MNTRLALYLSSSAFHSRTIYLKGGRRVSVFDRSKRLRMAARAMRKAGFRDYHIGIILGRPRSAVERVLAFEWRF